MTFSATELAALGTTQTTWMQDACKIGVYSSGVDSAGGPTSTYTYGAEIACGVDTHVGKAARHYYDSDGTYLYADVFVRLPVGTTVGPFDRIKITKRFGVAVTNVEYDLMNPPEVGISAILCYGRKVST
jgi:hypothetical protein